MSEIEFVFWVEIPIRVYAEYQPKEHATQTYPGCPETMGIDDIEVAGDELDGLVQPFPMDCEVSMEDLKNHILIKYDDELKMAAWERKE